MKMEKRHETQLLLKLDELWLKNTTFISYAEIYYWFNQSKIKKTPFKKIKECWIGVLEECGFEYKDFPIKLLQNDDMGGYMFFVLPKKIEAIEDRF